MLSASQGDKGLWCPRRYLDWVAAADGLPRDGRWSCGTHDYPSMHHSLMHPCSNADSQCCGNSRSAPFLLRYESFFHSQNALLVLAYEVGGGLFPQSFSFLGIPAPICQQQYDN